jgi:Dolichyl-phosphate-mannose-protein mannosyltransferase
MSEGSLPGLPVDRRARRMAAALVVGHIILAASYSVVNPIWEAPDEVGHFSFIQHLIGERKLPVLQSGVMGEAHQPPLYYLITAGASALAGSGDPTGDFELNPQFMWAGQGGTDVNIARHSTAETFPYRGRALALHLARLVSVLMGAATVALVIAIGWKIFPESPVVGLLAGALAAFNPQFLFISGSVNNDNLLVLAATGAWWQTLAAIKRPEQWRQWVFVGLWVAVAILAKTNGLVVGAVAFGALAGCAVQRRSFKLFVKDGLALSLIVVPLVAWWFIRNQTLYGDPLGWTKYAEVFAANMRYEALRLADLGEFVPTQFRSYWGVFGWMNLPAPSWWHRVAGALCLAAVLGLGVFLVGGRFGRLAAFQKAGLALLALALLAQEIYVLGLITRCNQSCYQGRYLFPAIAPITLLLALGLVTLMPQRWVPVLAAALSLVLLGVALLMPLKTIAPAYRAVPLPRWNLLTVPEKTDYLFGDMIVLRGYRTDANSDRSGVTLTLYWQALRRPDFDYSAFTHLLDPTDQIVGQKDQAPGEDRGYPPSIWRPEDIVADRHTISLPQGYSSDSYRFRVGLYNWTTGAPVPISSDGQPVGDFVILEGRPLR